MNLLQTELAEPPCLTADGFERLFECAPIAMLVEDAEGIVKDANAPAIELAGGLRSDLIGRATSEVLLPRLSQPVDPDSPRANALLSVDGETIAVSSVRSPATRDSGDVTLITMWAEGASAEAKPAAPSVGEGSAAPVDLDPLRNAASRIAHILNDRLTAIQGFVSLANQSLKTGVLHKDHLAQIEQAADESAALARSLLDFGRPLTPRRLVIDPNGLIDSLQQELEKKLGSQLSLVIELGDGVPEIESDARIVSNLLDHIFRNARAACPDGSLTIHTHFDADAGEVIIEVTDDGPGMDAAVVERAFEPFFSAPADSGTSGLGLAVVRAHMEALGGHAELRSEPGSGTTVALHFPAAESGDASLFPLENMSPLPTPEAPPTRSTPQSEEAPADSAKPARPGEEAQPKAANPRGGKETILVVEDEEMVRDLVQRSLGYLGYDVIVACNGAEGLAVARERCDEIDMVFSDIVMPRMSGPEMVAKMLQEHLDFPVLYTTGFTDNKRLLDNGEIREGVNLLPKPYTTKVLATRVREVLDNATH